MSNARHQNSSCTSISSKSSMDRDFEQKHSPPDERAAQSAFCKQDCVFLDHTQSSVPINLGEPESEHELWRQLREKEHEVMKLKEKLGIIPRSISVETETEQLCELNPSNRRAKALESFGALNSAALQLYRAAEAR